MRAFQFSAPLFIFYLCVLPACLQAADPPAGMVLIPGGVFCMGAENGLPSEKPVHAVKIDSFFMDCCLVTNEAYAAFCQAENYPLPVPPNFAGMADYLHAYPKHPVVGITWHDAEAYASWCGKRLPTEAEWEYASRGGLAGKDYPWGDGLPGPGQANFAAKESDMEWRVVHVADGYRFTSPVNHYTPNGFGLYDMAGNVWQWCSDWYQEDYYTHSPAVNPQGPDQGVEKVLRGGCWHSPFIDLRCSRRIHSPGWPGMSNIGFRCVQDLYPTAALPEKPGRTSAMDPLRGKPSPKPARALKPTKGFELTFGNDADEAQAKLYRSLGVTSVESYVTWESVERNGKGDWDFRRWDRQVEILKKHGLKWVPFLIAGCAYATPAWFRASDQHYPSVCLEHHMASTIQSIWNPALKPQIERFIAEFSKRYRDSGVIESVLLGVSGDFGEALYPVWGGGWTFIIPGVYHVHLGFWCGEEYARQAFRQYALQRYNDLHGINAAWGTAWNQAGEIDYPPLLMPEKSRYILPDESNGSGVPFHSNALERRRWLDFLSWYRQAMTDWSDWWLGLTRTYFPDHPIYLCTGGNAHPAHGSDFSDQCRAAARHRAGVRITNEASDYGENFYLTRWVASAGHFYDAYFGFEPAGGVSEDGIVARIYNATASGARQLHWYAGNLTASQQRIDRFEKNAGMIFPAMPKAPFALFYPSADLALNWTWIDRKINHFRERSAWLRDVVDHDYVDERMICDGALDRYRYLFVSDSGYVEAATLQAMDTWLRRGGVLLLLRSHRLLAVSGDPGFYRSWFPDSTAVHAIGQGRTIILNGSWDHRADLFRQLVQFFNRENRPLPDGIEDGVFVTRLTDGWYVYNSTDQTIDKPFFLSGRWVRKTLLPHTIRLYR
ncbi:SUMF1/EgtB/PvdO family nonheme iron enzyme [bacterium]|nr:SUMF1/EgtB/PvdO family nonheme iron enzyme [bacterium]